LQKNFLTFQPPQRLGKQPPEAIREDLNQYGISWEAPNLCHTISKKLLGMNGFRLDGDRNMMRISSLSWKTLSMKEKISHSSLKEYVDSSFARP
jgi:hypothetical protein